MCMPILTLVLTFFHIIVSFSVNLCISGLQSSFGEVSEYCDFLSKLRFFTKNSKKKKKTTFGSNCSSFILQLNAVNRINIIAVYNEIHIFNDFPYGIYMVAILSKF